MTQKRFGELTLFKLWVVPAAAFWICAAGFVGGVIVEKNSDPNKPLIPENVALGNVKFRGRVLEVSTHAIQGAAAIAMYSWLFGLAVVDAERKRAAKDKDAADS